MLAAGLSLVAVACGEAESWDADVVHSSATLFYAPGAQPPEDCVEVGKVHVPERDVGWLEGLFAMHIEAFYDDVGQQLAALGANRLIPSGELGAELVAETGRAFRGTAYACPKLVAN